MVGVRLREHLVTLGLTRLGEEDERSRVRGLGREREVEQDERVRVEVDEDRVPVEGDPGNDDEGLGEDVPRRPESPCQALGPNAEPVVSERRREAPVREDVTEGLLHEAERLVDDPLDRLLGHGQTVQMPSASPTRRAARRRGRRDRARRCSPGATRAQRAVIPALDRHLDAMTIVEARLQPGDVALRQFGSDHLAEPGLVRRERPDPERCQARRRLRGERPAAGAYFVPVVLGEEVDRGRHGQTRRRVVRARPAVPGTEPQLALAPADDERREPRLVLGPCPEEARALGAQSHLWQLPA